MASKKLSDFVKTFVSCRTTWEQGTGLMFKKKLHDSAYIFSFSSERKIPIHMMFVYFPIDVVWLDAEFRVVDFKVWAKPFALNICHKGKAKYLIELPVGKIEEMKLMIYDALELPKEYL